MTESNEMTEEEIERTEPDFVPGVENDPPPNARPVTVGTADATPNSNSPEGEPNQTSEASRRP